MVSFGDVNLSEDPIRGPPHNPGSGGWPTIRYFNKETGLDGGTYVKKTSKAMCEELGDQELMTEFIEEYGNASLCSVRDGAGCDEKEKGFIEKMRSKTSEELSAQLERLLKMEDNSMKPDLKKWLLKRKKILRQLVPQAGSDEL